MSAIETTPFRPSRLLLRIGTPRPLARLADAWPLLVIAAGGVLSLAWMAALVWAALALATWLV